MREKIQALKQKIEISQRILLQCHKNPDPDTIGAALSWKRILEDMGKEVEIIAPSKISKGMTDLFPEIENQIMSEVNFLTFDFSAFDFFLLNDTASISQLANTKDFKLPEVDIFVIDHHKSNSLNVEYKIVEHKTFSSTQILFNIFQELRYKIDKKVATYLYTGMLTDTYNFLYAHLDQSFFSTLGEIIELGADTKHVINTLHMSKSLDEINAMGHILNSIEIAGKNKKFAWVYFDHAEMDQFNISYHDLKDKVSDEVINTIEGTDFGVVIYKIEEKPNEFYLSIRARVEDFDCSDLAGKIGGGGHQSRAGANLEAGSIEEVLRAINANC